MTSQPLATAYLQIREPKKPLPPQTMSFLAAADMAGDKWCDLVRRLIVSGAPAMTRMCLTGVFIVWELDCE